MTNDDTPVSGWNDRLNNAFGAYWATKENDADTALYNLRIIFKEIPHFINTLLTRADYDQEKRAELLDWALAHINNCLGDLRNAGSLRGHSERHCLNKTGGEIILKFIEPAFEVMPQRAAYLFTSAIGSIPTQPHNGNYADELKAAFYQKLIVLAPKMMEQMPDVVMDATKDLIVFLADKNGFKEKSLVKMWADAADAAFLRNPQATSWNVTNTTLGWSNVRDTGLYSVAVEKGRELSFYMSWMPHPR